MCTPNARSDHGELATSPDLTSRLSQAGLRPWGAAAPQTPRLILGAPAPQTPSLGAAASQNHRGGLGGAAAPPTGGLGGRGVWGGGSSPWIEACLGYARRLLFRQGSGLDSLAAVGQVEAPRRATSPDRPRA